MEWSTTHLQHHGIITTNTIPSSPLNESTQANVVSLWLQIILIMTATNLMMMMMIHPVILLEGTK